MVDFAQILLYRRRDMGDLRDALKGPGQLVEKETRYPVTHFKGVYTDFQQLDKGEGGDTYVSVNSQFADIEILALAPGASYDFSTYEIAVSYNENAGSKWGRYVQSGGQASGADLATGIGFKALFDGYLQGRICELKLVAKEGNVKNRETDKWETGQVFAWEILSVEGSGVGVPVLSPDEVVTRLIGECSTKNEFLTKIMADKSISAQGGEFLAAAGTRYDTEKTVA